MQPVKMVFCEKKKSAKVADFKGKYSEIAIFKQYYSSSKVTV